MASVAEVVASDLCIGCGLCESIGAGVAMAATPNGSLRPAPVDGLTPAEERAVLAACPGVVAVAGDGDDALHHDLVWGAHRSLTTAWSADPDVRFRSSTGGVLTALGQHLLRSGRVTAVLHVGADPDHPIRSRWVLSTTPAEVLANAGSRYGPTAPLAGLGVALDRGAPFAVIAKPCDLGALHRYAALDERVDQLCTARLAMVCGGQSRLTRTTALLDRLGVAERDVAWLRYRGHGNPGPTAIGLRDGETRRVGYLELWADESSWQVETRCTLCPDALGECADVAALDAWPGGAPSGDDDGVNAVVVRTPRGEELLDSAVAAGALVVGSTLTTDELDRFQPHQVRKKRALAARYEGVARAGVAPIETSGLRLDELGAAVDGAWAQERDGARRRMEEAMAR